MSHALERTSPKGTPFVGQCTKCGKENVTLSMMHEHCVNPANITEAEALELALRLPAQSDAVREIPAVALGEAKPA